MDGMNGQSGREKISTELSKDDLLKYVELDLWNRFRERLWKVVAAVLTIITVAGFLGVPYYIRNEVTRHLVEREREFTERTKEVTEYSKLLALLRARYDGERYRFDGDVLRLVRALEEHSRKEATDKEEVSDDEEPNGVLLSLISRPNFREVVDGSAVAHVFNVPDHLKQKKILPATIFAVSGRGVRLTTADTESHPIRNGTYQGALTDLKLRIVVLEALSRTIDKMQVDMQAVGTNFGSIRTDPITVESLQAKEFLESFTSALSTVAKALLTKAEQAQLAQWQSLYTLGYVVNYRPQGDSPSPSKEIFK